MFKLSGKNILLVCSVFMIVNLPALSYAANGKGMTWGFKYMSFPVENRPGESTPNPVGSSVNGNNPKPPSWVNVNPPIGNLQKKSVFVGCGDAFGRGCNAYKGETSCTKKRHILCVKETGNIKRPPYEVNLSSGSMRKEFYEGWVSQRIKLGPKVKGTDLTSLAVANNKCGAGWKMAEFHMGKWIGGMGKNAHAGNSWNPAQARSGGWNFHARFQGNNNRLKKLKKNRFWVYSNTTKANCWD